MLGVIQEIQENRLVLVLICTNLSWCYVWETGVFFNQSDKTDNKKKKKHFWFSIENLHYVSYLCFLQSSIFNLYL